MLKKLTATCCLTVALLAAGAGTASAGEVTGGPNPKPVPAVGDLEAGIPPRANSICAFSGQNDLPNDPVEGGRVQNYGQLVKAGMKAEVPGPGDACNGHTGFFAGGGGEAP